MEPDKQLEGSWDTAADGGKYDLWVLGPNGWHRHFAGDLAQDRTAQQDAEIRVCYDIANAHFIGEDTADGLRQVRSRLEIVHLSDTGRQAWRHDPVGQGTCDFAGFGATLQESGYAKTSMLEIVSQQPVEDIVASHRKVTRWGWAPLVIQSQVHRPMPPE